MCVCKLHCCQSMLSPDSPLLLPVPLGLLLPVPKFHVDYIHLSYFVQLEASGSLREIMPEVCVEFCLGRVIHRFFWGACANLFRTGAASFCFTIDNHGHYSKISTQPFAWMKFRSRYPNLCRVDSALLAREQNLTYVRLDVRAFIDDSLGGV